MYEIGPYNVIFKFDEEIDLKRPLKKLEKISLGGLFLYFKGEDEFNLTTLNFL